MSLELVDFRGRLTQETDCVLEAESRATGRDKQVILRQVMDEWAAAKIAKASVLRQLLAGKGLVREGGGVRGRRATDFPAFAESGFVNGPGLE